jgi:hypothetical protein
MILLYYKNIKMNYYILHFLLKELEKNVYFLCSSFIIEYFGIFLALLSNKLRGSVIHYSTKSFTEFSFNLLTLFFLLSAIFNFFDINTDLDDIKSL